MNNEKRSAYTLRSLLEELKEKLPKIEKGQIFETLKSIYPDSETPKEKKNIQLEDATFTKPLALSRKDKSMLMKEDSKMLGFFKNLTRGDFLKVVELEGEKAKCINLSLKEDIAKKYYKEDRITLGIDELANGTVRLFRRKINKYLK
jgi:hypothetical protein